MGSPDTLLDHGFFRARAVSPVLSLAQPRDNAGRLRWRRRRRRKPRWPSF